MKENIPQIIRFCASNCLRSARCNDTFAIKTAFILQLFSPSRSTNNRKIVLKWNINFLFRISWNYSHSLHTVATCLFPLFCLFSDHLRSRYSIFLTMVHCLSFDIHFTLVILLHNVRCCRKKILRHHQSVTVINRVSYATQTIKIIMNNTKNKL